MLAEGDTDAEVEVESMPDMSFIELSLLPQAARVSVPATASAARASVFLCNVLLLDSSTHRSRFTGDGGGGSGSQLCLSSTRATNHPGLGVIGHEREDAVLERDDHVVPLAHPDAKAPAGTMIPLALGLPARAASVPASTTARPPSNRVRRVMVRLVAFISRYQ